MTYFILEKAAVTQYSHENGYNCRHAKIQVFHHELLFSF